MDDLSELGMVDSMISLTLYFTVCLQTACFCMVPSAVLWYGFSTRKFHVLY